MILLGIFVSIAILIWHPFEPRHEGKRLSVWVKVLFDTGEQADDIQLERQRQRSRDQATEAVRHIGTDALPYALRLLQAKDSAFKEKLIDLAKKQEIIHFHFTSADEKRVEGVEIFYALGPIAKPAVPSLIKLLQGQDPGAAEMASYALASIGPDAINPLIGMLGNSNAKTRSLAARALGVLQSKAQAAVPALLLCLKDPNHEVRQDTAAALGYIGGDATTIVPALITCLEEQTNMMRLRIISAIGRFGTNARPAIPVLVKIVETNEMFTSSWAFSTLRKIDPQITNEFIYDRGEFIRTNASPEDPLLFRQPNTNSSR